MPRSFQILKFCEACFTATGENVTASATFTVGIIDSETVRPVLHTVDACAEHAELLAGVLKFVQEAPPWEPPAVASTAKALATTRRAVPGTPTACCPVCQDMFTEGSLPSHIWNQHRPDAKPTGLTICPTCGKHFETSKGLGSHRSVNHNYNALQDALSGVPGYVDQRPRNGHVTPVVKTSPVLFEAAQQKPVLARGVVAGGRMEELVARLQQTPGEWVLIEENVSANNRRNALKRWGIECQARHAVGGIGPLWARWPADQDRSPAAGVHAGAQ